MLVIGKSIAALTFICDAAVSHQVHQRIKIINNIGIEKGFFFPGITIVESDKLSKEDLYRLSVNEEMVVLGAVMPETKRKLAGLFPLEYDSLFHKNRAINNCENIGDGCLIDAMVTISGNAMLENYITIYCNSSINHNCEIGDYVTLCPNVTLCGNVKVGEGTFIGAGAVVKNEVSIGKNCIIGCGSVVIKDVPDNTTVYGNPAKVKE